MEDTHIIDLFFQRSEWALEAVCDKYGTYCRCIARNILALPEDVEECINDTWYALWQQIPPARPQSLRSYCGRIVRNLCISRYRAQHAGRRYVQMELLLSELEDCIPAEETPEQSVDRLLLSETISQWLRTLRDEDRRVFLRRYWYGDPVDRLAREQGVRPNAMTQRLLRLRRQLRHTLEEKGVTV